MNISIKFASALAVTHNLPELSLEFQSDEVAFIELLKYFELNYQLVYNKICTSQFHIHPYIICVLNQKIITNKDIETEKLKNGDTVTFSVAIAGGVN